MTFEKGDNPSSPHAPRFCSDCGAALVDGERHCRMCGADIAAQITQRETVLTASAGDRDQPVPLIAYNPPPERKRRRRRRWYRRPWRVALFAFLMVLAISAGAMGFRTFRAFQEVNELSTPPPEISGAALGGEATLTIDTGPAQAAVQTWEAAKTQAAETAANGQTAPTTSVATATTTPAPTRTAPTDEAPSSTVSPTQAPTPTPTTVAQSTDEADIIGPSGDSKRRTSVPPTPSPTSTIAATSTTPPTVAPTATTALDITTSSASEQVNTGVNILLMGVDARDGESIDIGVRPDALGILNLNEEAGTCRILAVPRDSRVEMPGYGLTKINHALAVGGIPFEMMVVEQYLGISIDHFALVDFSGLVGVVDSFGGVTVENDEDFVISGHHFAVGELHLTGEEALLYTRYRGGTNGDYGRVARQQQILRALLDNASQRNLAKLVPDLWALLQDHFRTDYGVTGLVDTAVDFRGICTSTTLETMSIPGDVQTLPDDMMKMNLSFVVSDPAVVQSAVNWLLTGEVPEFRRDAEGRDATPTPPSDTGPDPASTPASSGTLMTWWRRDQH